MIEQHALLELRGLTKSFGGALALDQVDLTVLPGEVHGLLGENGSGKSTLIKILAGYHDPDAGTMSVRGQPVDLPLAPGAYRQLGFEFVHQDLGLVNSLSVVENLFMSQIAEPKNSAFYSWHQATREARRIFARYGQAIDPRAPVEEIRPVERAMLAIIRALEGLGAVDESLHGKTVLVLDEPTVFLPRNEILLLFDFIRTIAKGGSSVLFVSHDLDEVKRITDRVTVLRDGRVAGTVVTADTTPRDLVRLIIGRDLADSAGVEVMPDSGRRVVLRIQGLTTQWLDDVSFDVHEGEVLGLTGLVGSGFEDVAYAIYGATPARGGTLTVDDTELAIPEMTPSRALDHRITLVPGDRPRNGSVATLSASDNINMPVLSQYFRRGRLRRRDLYRNAAELMHQFDVRPLRPEFEYRILLWRKPAKGHDGEVAPGGTPGPALARADAGGGCWRPAADLQPHHGRLGHEGDGLRQLRLRATDHHLQSRRSHRPGPHRRLPHWRRDHEGPHRRLLPPQLDQSDGSDE